METTTLDQAIDTAMQLSPAQREMLLQILRSREIEARRGEIAAAARESIAAYRAGEVGPQTADAVVTALRQALQDGE